MAVHRKRRLACVGAIVLALGCARSDRIPPSDAPADAGSTMEPRPTAVTPAAAARAVATVAPRPCREQLRRELASGRRLDDRCGEQRRRVTKTLIDGRRSVRFGVVDHRDVDLVEIDLRVSEASRCRGWPLQSPRHTELEPAEAARQRCRLRPYRGPIRVAAVSADGRRHDDVLTLHTDRDGRVALVFAEVDAALRAESRGSLDDYRSLEIGHGGWAGTVDLARLRNFTADWHLRWVQSGRGSVALFVQRHPDHPKAADAEALAVEARITRQRQDLAAVEAGELSPRAFLDRHVWSPFRRKVEQLAAADR